MAKIAPAKFPASVDVKADNIAVMKNIAICSQQAILESQKLEMKPARPITAKGSTYRFVIAWARSRPCWQISEPALMTSVTPATAPIVKPTIFFRPSGAATKPKQAIHRPANLPTRVCGAAVIGSISSISSQCTFTTFHWSSSTTASKFQAPEAIGLYFPSRASSSRSRL